MSFLPLAELQRRRVFRALVGYGIVAFGVLQIIEPIMHGLHWPDAVLSYTVGALAVGFPVVVGVAWIFDVNARRLETAARQPARVRVLLALVAAVAIAPAAAWYFAFRARPAAPALPTLAVLPFTDMSPGKDQEYLSDGIAEEILNALAQVEGLRVTGRTSSFSFKGKSADIAAIAEKLHVAHLLEGSVRKDGNHVRITAQLVSTADGYHVWSKTFDRELPGVFAVQDEIARAIVDALKVKLLPGKARVTNPDAYALYLLGNQMEREGSAYPPRIAAYEKAVALDPDYAPAWAKLAVQLRYRPPGETPEGKAARRRRALEAVEKSLALDPALPEGYSIRGLLRLEFLWDFNGARSDFERSISLNPGDARAVRDYGSLLELLGHGAEGIRLELKATEIDPLLFSNWEFLGNSYANERQYALCRSAFQRAIELTSPRNPDANLGMGWCYFLDGKTEQAVPYWDRLEDEDSRLMAQAALAQRRGQSGPADAALAALIAKAGATHPYWIAQLLALRGERDRAFEWLDKGKAVLDEDMSGAKVDPALDSLRGDQRYTELLRKMNLPAD